MKIENVLPGVRKNVSLKNYTTFKIGGRAKYFFEAKTKEDLLDAIVVAKNFKLPFFILGGGSNLLVSDRGFGGLIIKIANCNLQIIDCEVCVDAGVPLVKLVSVATKSGLSGLAWAAGIPGTVGGAIHGNAGAFGKSMKDIVSEVEVLDCRCLKIKKFKNKDCKFIYRNSVFKNKNNLIILSAKLLLKGSKLGDESKDSSSHIVSARVKEYLDYKKTNHPWNYPSAGSVFKNPSGFSAGDLIERAGLKGKRIGNAEISRKHANFIVNLGGAREKDVTRLINLVKKTVKKKFKINLQEEIQFL